MSCIKYLNRYKNIDKTPASMFFLFFSITIFLNIFTFVKSEDKPHYHYPGQHPHLQKYGKKYGEECRNHKDCYTPWMHFCINPKSMNMTTKLCLCPTTYNYKSYYDDNGWAAFKCQASFGNKCVNNTPEELKWVDDTYKVDADTFLCFDTNIKICREYSSCGCTVGKGASWLRHYFHELFYYIKSQYLKENSGKSIYGDKHDFFDYPCTTDLRCPSGTTHEYEHVCMEGLSLFGQKCGGREGWECEPPLECETNELCKCPKGYEFNFLTHTCDELKEECGGSVGGGKQKELGASCRKNSNQPHEQCDESLGLKCAEEPAILQMVQGIDKKGCTSCECNSERRENPNPHMKQRYPCIYKYEPLCDT